MQRFSISISRRVPAAVLLIFILSAVRAAAGSGAGLSLEELLTEAESRNTDLQAAREEIEYSEENLGYAKMRRLPTVTASSSYSCLTDPMDSITVTSSEITDSLGLPSSSHEEIIELYEGQKNTLFKAELTIEQPVFTWGKIDLGIDIAGQAVEMNNLVLLKTETELNTTLCALYYSLNLLEQLKTELALQVDAADRLARLAEENFKNGFVTETEYLDVQAQISQIRITQADVDSRIVSTLAYIGFITGNETLRAGDIDFSGIDDFSAYAEFPEAEQLFVQAESGSIELQMMRKQIELTDSNLRLSEKSGSKLPDIGMQISLNNSGPLVPFLQTDWYRQNGMGATISLAASSNLFDSGQSLSKTASSRNDLKAAERMLESGIQELRKFVIETNAAMNSSLIKIQQSKILENSLEKKTELYKKQMDNGTGTESAYLSEFVELQSRKMQTLQFKMEFYQNYFKLAAAAGKNFSEEKLYK